MTRIQLIFACLLASVSLSAQFDTIAGPFAGRFTTDAKSIYAVISPSFGGSTVREFLPDRSNPEGRIVWEDRTGAFSGSPLIMGADIYVPTSTPNFRGGYIYRVQNYREAEPVTERLVETNLMPYAMVAWNDRIIVAVREGFTGSALYSFNPTDSIPVLESMNFAPQGLVTDLHVVGDVLYMGDKTNNFSTQPQDRVWGVDLRRSTLRLRPVTEFFDGMEGLAIADNRLYVAVNNINSNRGSAINVYELDGTQQARLVDQIGMGTLLFLNDIDELDGDIYLSELRVLEDDQPYLLRVRQTTSSTTAFSTPLLAPFPNPTTGLIRLPGPPAQRIQVHNAAGQQVMDVTNRTAELDLRALPSGLYTLLATGAAGQLSRGKIIKR